MDHRWATDGHGVGVGVGAGSSQRRFGRRYCGEVNQNRGLVGFQALKRLPRCLKRFSPLVGRESLTVRLFCAFVRASGASSSSIDSTLSRPRDHVSELAYNPESVNWPALQRSLQP